MGAKVAGCKNVLENNQIIKMGSKISGCLNLMLKALLEKHVSPC